MIWDHLKIEYWGISIIPVDISLRKIQTGTIKLTEKDQLEYFNSIKGSNFARVNTINKFYFFLYKKILRCFHILIMLKENPTINPERDCFIPLSEEFFK